MKMKNIKIKIGGTNPAHRKFESRMLLLPRWSPHLRASTPHPLKDCRSVTLDGSGFMNKFGNAPVGLII